MHFCYHIRRKKGGKRIKENNKDKTYKIVLYETENGKSQISDFLENLKRKLPTSKDARIQYNKIFLYLSLLSENGTDLSENITKHIEENIWELRPNSNRIFYFYIEEDTFVLLHQFRKKSNKTPRREIERAKRERDDYLSRKGRGKL